jgi:hypothetical protein
MTATGEAAAGWRPVRQGIDQGINFGRVGQNAVPSPKTTLDMPRRTTGGGFRSMVYPWMWTD